MSSQQNYSIAIQQPRLDLDPKMRMTKEESKSFEGASRTDEPFTDPSSPINLNNTTLQGNVSLDSTLILEDVFSAGYPARMYNGSTIGTESEVGSAAVFSEASSASAISIYGKLRQRVHHHDNGIEKKKRRRPRPWDDENHNPNSSFSSNGASKENHDKLTRKKPLSNMESMAAGEETPLLPTRNTHNCASDKTQKWGNTTSANLRTHIGSDHSVDYTHLQSDSPHVKYHQHKNGMQHHDFAPVPLTALRWSGGFFGSGKSVQTEENEEPLFNTILQSAKKMFSNSRSERITRTANDSFTTFLIFAINTHFCIMAGYELYLLYTFYRNSSDSGSNYSNSGIPPLWWSAEGRVYNPTFGPNPRTLNTFGILNPSLLLLKSQFWRMISSITLNSSFLQLLLNWFVLKKVISDMEKRCGSWMIARTFYMCAVVGGMFCILETCLHRRESGNMTVQMTGLCNAGISGILSLGLVEMFLNRCSGRYRLYWSSERSDGDARASSKSAKWRWGYLHTSFLLEILNGVFMPYTSLESVIGGAIMGVSFGMFLFAVLLRKMHENDRSSSSPTLSDLEAAFDPMVKTPPRKSKGAYNLRNDLDIPPPPPSSSSKGACDTPVMRRSILVSPDEEEEEEEQLDFHNFDNPRLGLHAKAGSNINSIHFYNDASSALSTPHKSARKKAANFLTTELIVRRFGFCLGLIVFIIPPLFLGFVIDETPTYQSMIDSMYGCKTMRGLYKYTMVTNDIDDTTESPFVANGDFVCGEVCIPLSLVSVAMGDGSDVWMTEGPCSNLGYRCPFMTDTLEIKGTYDIVREVYLRYSSDGSCSVDSTNYMEEEKTSDDADESVGSE